MLYYRRRHFSKNSGDEEYQIERAALLSCTLPLRNNGSNFSSALAVHHRRALELRRVNGLEWREKQRHT
jgi:hypothetical protein